ncbi:MAG: glycosyltransferase [Myxococcota bacterium]
MLKLPLSVVMIVRDEACRLPGALASLGAMSDLVVCDTGSGDGTLDLAAAVGARVFEVPWVGDFAVARSVAQRHARYDWILRLDADERLHVARGRPQEWLAWTIQRAEREEADIVYVRRRYSPTNQHWFPRLFRADRFRWVSPLHERLVPVGERRRAIAASGAVFLHRPAERARGYADLAARHLARTPGDPHLLYYRARSAWEEGRVGESLPALRAYLAGPTDYRFHRGESHRLLGLALAATGETAEAIRHLVEGTLGDGMRAEAGADLVRLHLVRGERAEARRWIGRIAGVAPPRERAPWGGWRRPYLLEAPAWRTSTWRAAWRRAT